jgi:hypothetical protein
MLEGILAIQCLRLDGDGIADQVGMQVQFSVAQAMATFVAMIPASVGILVRITCRPMPRRSHQERGGATTLSFRTESRS